MKSVFHQLNLLNWHQIIRQVDIRIYNQIQGQVQDRVAEQVFSQVYRQVRRIL